MIIREFFLLHINALLAICIQYVTCLPNAIEYQGFQLLALLEPIFTKFDFALTADYTSLMGTHCEGLFVHCGHAQVHTHIHTHTHNTHTHNKRTHTCTHTYTHAHTHAHTHTYTYTHTPCTCITHVQTCKFTQS